MKHSLVFFCWCVGYLLEAGAQTPAVHKRYTISGYVREKGSQEALIGVHILQAGTSTGTVTNT